MDNKLVVFTDVKGITRIKYENNGEVPQELSGIYTSVREAQNGIERYMNTQGYTKPLKLKENAKSPV